jgi:hypothetical protein
MGRRIQRPESGKTYRLDEIDFGTGAESVLRRASLEEILRLRRESGYVGEDGQRRCRTIPRFVYYRMVAQHIVPKDALCVPQEGINPRTGKPYKSAKKSSDRVSKVLTWLRGEGWVFDDEIVDESRSSVDNTGYRSIKHGLLEQLPYIPLDPWDDDPPVLAVESRSLQSFFSVLARTYRIAVVPLGGQSSRSYLANDVPLRLGKQTLVLYVGDYDKAGGDIENSACDRLRELAPHWNGEWDRVAVTNAQFQVGVRDGLTVIKTDDRFSPPRSFETLEAEGVEQSVLEDSVRNELARLLRLRGTMSLAEMAAEEERQREVARRRIRRWR